MTHPSPNELLQRLEPSIRPGAERFGGASRSAATPGEFDDLLALVSNARLGSGRQVHDAADLAPPLSASQYERLAAAADKAEAAGAEHALMLLDGRALVMDVESRSITEELSAVDAHDLTTNIDAAVVVAGGAEGAAPLGPPAAGMLPADLVEQLERAASSRPPEP